MQHRAGVFDVWVYRKDEDAVRYLLLHTSQEKADRWFNGGRFWQIPSDCVEGDESMVTAMRRCLTRFGIESSSLWAVDHAYTIYNRRFEEIHLILVFAAEAGPGTEIRLTWEHAEHRWCTASECQQLIGFRGLQEGLDWVRRFVTETSNQLPELKLA
jgi:hypothetical protein